MPEIIDEAVVEEQQVTEPAQEVTPPEVEPEQEPQEADATVDEQPDPEALRAEIEELKKAREKAEQDTRYWRKQRVEARGEYFKGRSDEPEQGRPPRTEVRDSKEPNPDDYKTYDAFVDAKIRHEVQKARMSWDRDMIMRQQMTEAEKRNATLQQKLGEGYSRFKDFEDVALDPTAPISVTVREILHDSEDPAGVAYYLGKNRAEAASISRMNPIAAARAIAKIEAEIKGSAPPPQATKKHVSNAPPPVKPLGTGGSVVNKDPAKMTQAEYEKWRISQGARRF